MRELVACIFALALFTAASCGGHATYAGLTRGEAVKAAKTKIEAHLQPTKRHYYEVSIWNVAAEHGEDDSGEPAWLIGIWNGQSDTGACAIASRTSGMTTVRLIACEAFPRYAR